MLEKLVLETRLGPEGISFGTTETLIISLFVVVLILGAIFLWKRE